MKWFYVNNRHQLRLAGDFESGGAACDDVRYKTGSWPVVAVSEGDASEWLYELTRLLGPSSVDQESLWEAQQSFWYDSSRLSPREVFTWAEAMPDTERKLLRYRAISRALQFPAFVFYRTKPVGGHMGCRFGLERHQYLSGFDDL